MIGIILQALYWFKNILEISIFIIVLLSWFPVDKNNFFYKLLQDITNPILLPVRKMIYNSPLGGPGMMIDFSPMIAILLIELVFKAIYYIIARI